MRSSKYLFIMLLLTLGGCESGSDDITIINNYITEIQEATFSEEQSSIGSFELKTTVEADFFVLAKEIGSLEFYYSNSNAFHFDKNGYLVNKSGSPLLVYPVNQDGSSAAVSISVSQPVKINYDMGKPKATDRADISLNLPKSNSELSSSEFNNQDPLTFNNSTSVTVYDSLGESHVLTFYFIHINVDNNTWELRIALDNNTIQSSAELILDFSSDGLLDVNDSDLDGFITTENGLIENYGISLSNSADNISITLDFTTDTTSFNSSFEVSSLIASGFYTDHLEEFKIDSDGLVTLSYVHGEDILIGRVALAKFPSPYNLQSLDNDLWAETSNSGEATYGEPELDNFGTVIPLIYDY